MYRVEVSKLVGPSCLLVPENSFGRLVCSRYRYLPCSAIFQANLELIHSISRPMCAILQKISGGRLSLCLA